MRGVVGYVGGSYWKLTTDGMVGIAVRPGRGITSIGRDPPPVPGSFRPFGI